MNNAAFQKLVHQRANVKSTRDIAREAVQTEFRKKRGRQRGGGGGSDDDSAGGGGSSDEEDGGRRKERRKLENSKGKQDGKEEEDEDGPSSLYRDRAKERREAGAKPDADAVRIVKGLDLNLARSVKQQTKRPAEGDDKVGEKEANGFVQNREEALQFITSASATTTATSTGPAVAALSSSPAKSELGKEMLNYLRSTFLTRDKSTDSDKKIAVTPAGLTIQQSALTFSVQAHPGDTLRAWEVPREQTYASVDCRRLYEKASPCNDTTLLEKMEKMFEHANRREEAKKKSTQQPQQQNDADADDSDDDDIFGNIGDYDPLAAVDLDKNDDEDSNKAGRPKVDKGSLFEDDTKKSMVPESADASATGTDHTDIGVDDDQGDLNASVPTTKLVGLSSSFAVSATGYGDEMDVDFDGRIQDNEEEEEDKGNKKKKKKRKRKNKESEEDD